MNKSPFDKDFLRNSSLLLIFLTIVSSLVYMHHAMEWVAHLFHWSELTTQKVFATLFYVLVASLLWGLLIHRKILLNETKDKIKEKRKNSIFIFSCIAIYFPYIWIYVLNFCPCEIDKSEFKETAQKLNATILAKFDSIAITSSPFNKNSITENIQLFTNSLINNHLQGEDFSNLKDKERKNWKDSLLFEFKKDNTFKIKIDSFFNSKLSRDLNELEPYLNSPTFVEDFGKVKQNYDISDTAFFITNNQFIIRENSFKLATQTLFYNHNLIEVTRTTINNNYQIDSIFLNCK